MKEKHRIDKALVMVFGCLFVAVSIVLILLTLNKNSEYIDNTTVHAVKIDNIICESSNVSYPGISEANAVQKRMKINLIFEGDLIETIGLLYTLDFEDEQSANNAKILSESSVSSMTGNAGIGSVDSLNHKFSISGQRLSYNLFAKKKDIISAALPFLLLSTNGSEDISYNKRDIIMNYKNVGFMCQE